MEKRVENFQRNSKLENLLNEINEDLKPTEEKLVGKVKHKYPVILVMGALRSGTTLTTQWLANSGQFCYPTNIMSRFYKSPIMGAKIQKLLLDQEFDFRGEIVDFSKEVNYCSENGKTKGALSPNEFWYFWRRFLPYDSQSIDYLPDAELLENVDWKLFQKELMGVAQVFNKPIAMKGMIANYNIGLLNQILDQVVFLFVKREPCSNIRSVLGARERQYGDMTKWYSFHIPEMESLMQLSDPIMQAAGQIYLINQAVEIGLKNVSEERKLEIQYEDFCVNPERYYHQLRAKLGKQGFEISQKYYGEKEFQIMNAEITPEIELGYLKYMDLMMLEKEGNK